MRLQVNAVIGCHFAHTFYLVSFYLAQKETKRKKSFCFSLFCLNFFNQFLTQFLFINLTAHFRLGES